MSIYDRQQDPVRRVAGIFACPGRILGFLGMWLLASLASWLLGALPAWLLLPLAWVGFIGPDDKGGKVAIVFIAATLVAGLIVLGLFWTSSSERYIRHAAPRFRSWRLR